MAARRTSIDFFGVNNASIDFLQGGLYCGRHGCELLGRPSYEGRTHRTRKLVCNICRHILRHQRCLEVLQNGPEVCFGEHCATSEILHPASERLEETPNSASFLFLPFTLVV